MNGWFAMSRAMFDHPIFAGNMERVGVWAWMVATAAWKDTRQDANGQTVLVKRGQLLTSYRQMSKATGAGVKVLRNLLARLEEEGAIGRECIGHKHGTCGGTVRTLITIRNYEKYQSINNNGGTGEGTEGAQVGHTKEQGNKDNTLDANASNDAGASPVEFNFYSKAVWDYGKPYLASHGVKEPGKLIGKWLRDYEARDLIEAITAAQKSGTQDPIPYITKALQPEAPVRNASQILAELKARGEL